MIGKHDFAGNKYCQQCKIERGLPVFQFPPPPPLNPKQLDLMKLSGYTDFQLKAFVEAHLSRVYESVFVKHILSAKNWDGICKQELILWIGAIQRHLNLCNFTIQYWIEENVPACFKKPLPALS